MIILDKKNKVIINKYNAEDYEDIIIAKQKNNNLLVVQDAIKTRMRKENFSRHTNAPLREIKKWFETRAI